MDRQAYWTNLLQEARAKIAEKFVGAESFTSGDTKARWTQHPFSLKPLGDEAFCMGVTRFIFHRYAMQPWKDLRPGMTMGPWGIHFERTNTWWEPGGAWLCHNMPSAMPWRLRRWWLLWSGSTSSPSSSSARGAGGRLPLRGLCRGWQWQRRWL